MPGVPPYELRVARVQPVGCEWLEFVGDWPAGVAPCVVTPVSRQPVDPALDWLPSHLPSNRGKSDALFAQYVPGLTDDQYSRLVADLRRRGWNDSELSERVAIHRPTAGAAPTSESYWVVEGKVLAGKYPGAKFDAAAGTKIEALVAAGVRTFVDLTENDELLTYAQLLPDGVAHHRVAVVDVTSPSREQVREALDMIDAGLANGVVYVHCRGGCGRTGVIIGAYLVRHGTSPARALERVHDLTRALWDRPCPETREQIAMVETWGRGE